MHRRTMLGRTILVGMAALAPPPAAAQQADAATRAELLPTGRLRVGVGIGPAASAFWATRGPDGQPRGVTLVLAEEAARRLGAPLEVQPYNSSGEVTEAGARGAWDLSFMPVDPQRAAMLEFGPDYFLFTSTYLVPAGSAIRSIAEVDRPGVRVFGVANTTTIRAAQRAQPNATFTGATGVDEVLERMARGEVDAVALGRESLESLLPRLPGARILDGHFHATGTAVAVPRGRPLAHGWASAFIESAKADGTVRRALDSVGIAGPVAPSGSRSAGA
jgi:polar amino acid transport system substrate-binding protein